MCYRFAVPDIVTVIFFFFSLFLYVFNSSVAGLQLAKFTV